MKNVLKPSLLIVMSLLAATESFAAADITFHGTLINLTCKIGDDQPIDINFGDEVVTDLIDGEHYKHDVPLTIKCSQDYSGDLNFTVSGTPSTFETTALTTDVNQLGIRFIDASSDIPIEINKSYVHKNNDSVDLKVVPVKENGAAFSGGAFTATAQLLVEPQ